MADSVKVVEYLISLKDALKIVKVLSKKKHRRFNWEFELEELPFEEARERLRTYSIVLARNPNHSDQRLIAETAFKGPALYDPSYELTLIYPLKDLAEARVKYRTNPICVLKVFKGPLIR